MGRPHGQEILLLALHVLPGYPLRFTCCRTWREMGKVGQEASQLSLPPSEVSPWHSASAWRHCFRSPSQWVQTQEYRARLSVGAVLPPSRVLPVANFFVV